MLMVIINDVISKKKLRLVFNLIKCTDNADLKILSLFLSLSFSFDMCFYNQIL